MSRRGSFVHVWCFLCCCEALEVSYHHILPWCFIWSFMLLSSCFAKWTPAGSPSFDCVHVCFFLTLCLLLYLSFVHLLFWLIICLINDIIVHILTLVIAQHYPGLIRHWMCFPFAADTKAPKSPQACYYTVNMQSSAGLRRMHLQPPAIWAVNRTQTDSCFDWFPPGRCPTIISSLQWRFDQCSVPSSPTLKCFYLLILTLMPSQMSDVHSINGGWFWERVILLGLMSLLHV